MTLASALLEAGAHVYLLDVLSAPSEVEYSALTSKAQEGGLSVAYYRVRLISGASCSLFTPLVSHTQGGCHEDRRGGRRLPVDS
jgi:hypothetical protein